MKRQDYTKLINTLCNSLELITIQLVINHHKAAGSIVVRIPNYSSNIKFKKIVDKNFIWFFENLEENDLVQISVVDKKKMRIKNKLYKELLETEFNIVVKNVVEDVFERFLRLASKQGLIRSSYLSIIKYNLITGLYYDYPLREILEYIKENYIEQKKRKNRKAIFFYTQNDQMGIISYFNDNKFVENLKRLYCKICLSHGYKAKVFNNYKKFNIPIINF